MDAPHGYSFPPDLNKFHAKYKKTKIGKEALEMKKKLIEALGIEEDSSILPRLI